MRTRFKKIWCDRCSSMQFAGECGHGLIEAPDAKLMHILNMGESRPPFAVQALNFARSAFGDMPDELLRKMGLRRL